MARLPVPGSDQGVWGQILNDYLSTTHNADGTLKSGAVTAASIVDGSIAKTKLSASGGTNGQVLATDGTNLTWSTPSSGTPSDATTTVKGVVQLAGDLAGTASAPTVPGLAGKANSTHTHVASDTTAGVFDIARIPTGTTGTTVALGNHTHTGYEPTITAGTTSQYYRGDKSFQTLDKSAVGLASVDNTSDANKPVSNAVQTSLDAKANSIYTINPQTSSYTLVLGDAGKFITITSASATNLTVPTNASVAFAIGTRIAFVQMGAGQVTVVASGGVAVFADPGLKIAAQYGGAELVKLATDTWILVGRLAA